MKMLPFPWEAIPPWNRPSLMKCFLILFLNLYSFLHLLISLWYTLHNAQHTQQSWYSDGSLEDTSNPMVKPSKKNQTSTGRSQQFHHVHRNTNRHAFFNTDSLLSLFQHSPRLVQLGECVPYIVLVILQSD